MSLSLPLHDRPLDVLALAGCQERDKIAELPNGRVTPGASDRPGLGGLLGKLGSSLEGAGAGGFASGALRELVDHFKQSGHDDTAPSWVGTRPNKSVSYTPQGSVPEANLSRG